MLLCDVGNTSVHFERDGVRRSQSAAAFDPASVSETLFFVSVNAALDPFLGAQPNWHDLRPFIAWERYYESMGIDRVCACEAVEEGVVVDAGSAVTVDVMRAGRHEGGFILPGLRAMASCYEGISERLACSFNFEVDLDKMPNNSRDAVSYGYLAPLAREVKRFGLPVYLTGGDAERFAPLFPGAVVDDGLVFEGMKKIIQKAHLC